MFIERFVIITLLLAANSIQVNFMTMNQTSAGKQLYQN